jgi:hypothetical protein
VFHRIDRADELPSRKFLTLVALLPAYGGALSLRLRILPAAQAVTTSAAQPDSDNTPPEVIAARWRETLAREFPDAAAGGIEVVSDTEMERMLIA